MLQHQVSQLIRCYYFSISNPNSTDFLLDIILNNQFWISIGHDSVTIYCSFVFKISTRFIL